MGKGLAGEEGMEDTMPRRLNPDLGLPDGNQGIMGCVSRRKMV